MKAARIAAVCASLLASMIPRIGRAQAYSLDDALSAMREEHPLIVAAGSVADAAEADAVDDGLWTNPVLDASYNPGVANSSYDPAGYLTWGISQFIEVADTPGARARVGRLLALAAHADREAIARELGIEVEAAGVRYCAAVRQREVIVALLAHLEEVEAVVLERVRAGAALDYDHSRFGLVLATARAELAADEGRVAATEGELRAAIGPGSTHLRGTLRCSDLDAPALPSLAALTSTLSERPDIVAARTRSEAAAAAIDVAHRAVWPGFSLRLGANFGAAPGQVDVFVGLALPIPMLDFGQGTIPAAEARADAASQLADALELEARLRLEGLYRAADIARHAEEALQPEGAASEHMLEEALSGYQNGRFSVLELSDAYEAWGQARAMWTRMSEAARDAELDLGRELGRSVRDAR